MHHPILQYKDSAKFSADDFNAKYASKYLAWMVISPPKDRFFKIFAGFSKFASGCLVALSDFDSSDFSISPEASLGWQG